MQQLYRLLNFLGGLNIHVSIVSFQLKQMIEEKENKGKTKSE